MRQVAREEVDETEKSECYIRLLDMFLLLKYKFTFNILVIVITRDYSYLHDARRNRANRKLDMRGYRC